VLINTGLTAAHNIQVRAKAEILPVPLSPNFYFSLPPRVKGPGSLLPPRADATITRLIDDFIPDEEVDDVKRARGRALYSWGVITYQDEFKKIRRTTFCQVIEWINTGDKYKDPIRGQYIDRHNEAT
jgi:hypothetical protein